LDMRSDSDPRRRIAWQPETPMSKALWENESLHEAIISATGPSSSEGRPIGKRARASVSGILSILGMLLEPGEPAQPGFGWHQRGTTSPHSRGDCSAQSVMLRILSRTRCVLEVESQNGPGICRPSPG